MERLKDVSLSFFVDKDEIKKALALGESTLRDLRDKGEWIENVHFVYFNPRSPQSGIRYNLAMCINWMATRGRPELHEKAMEIYWTELYEGVAGEQLGSLRAVVVSALELRKTTQVVEQKAPRSTRLERG